MLEFPKIEDLYKTEQSDIEPVKETDLPVENKEKIKNGEKKLPHTIEASFKTNPDGLIDIKMEYGTLKNISKDLLPDDLKKEKNGKFEVAFTNNKTIAKEMLNRLLETANED